LKTKLHIIAIFLLFGIYANVHSQNVFPTSDAIWNIQINGKEHYYGLSGDTVINDKSYNKLYSLNDTIMDSKEVCIGAFRQEGKKVWYRPAAFMPWRYGDELEGETLLYDFSKNVGDTIWHNLLFQSGCYMGENITASIIYDIVESAYGRIYKTCQYINNSTDEFINLYPMMGRSDSWVEGIGSLSGLFWFLDNPPMSGGSSFKLACFKQGDEIKYMNNSICNVCFCKNTVGVSEKDNIRL
jgi:hypothetical protein